MSPTALVTGAGRGLGLALTHALLDTGHRVVATVRRPERADALRALDAGDRLHIAALDVADTASIAALPGQLADHPAIDLLVHNAGINSRSVDGGAPNVRFGELEPEGLLRMLRVNAVGPALLTQALTDRLGRGARVVGISSWLGSIAGKRSGGNYGYCTSKAALNMVLRTMAHDLAPAGVTVVGVNPGWVRTDMGGPRAQRTPEQAAREIVGLAAGLTAADSGRFLDCDGADHAW